MAKRTKPTDIEFVRMYYEHQYERVAKLEESRLTITNYVLTLSALVFTFGYQDATTFSVIEGIVLPLIIIVANYFPMRYIDRSTQFIYAHKERAKTILKDYAPDLGLLNDKITWADSAGFWGSRKRLQKAIHGLVMMIALIPFGIYIYQLWL